MDGWIAIALVGVVIVGVIIFQNCKNKGRENSNRQTPTATPSPTQQTTHLSQRTETGRMIYFANDRHGRKDKEYHFNYKKVDGAWRAYILRMPDLGSRDPNSIPTHRLWDNGQPYICWKGRVTSLKDMQTISRYWADAIQEYIATGKRFGEEQDR